MLIQDILEARGGLHDRAGIHFGRRRHRTGEKKIGSLLICRHDEQGETELLGIVTERDILYQFASEPDHSAGIPVSEVMTKMSSPRRPATASRKFSAS